MHPVLPPFASRRPRTAPLLLLAALLGLFGVAAARPAAAQTTYQVTTLADDGSPGSLRDAITSVNADSGNTRGDFITFAAGLGGTILLGSALPALNAGVTITGPGAGVLAVDGAGQYQPFSVNSGVTATLSDLTIQNGNDSHASNYGGGVSNGGTLTLTGCTLEGNSAQDFGGGVFNQGMLTLTGCTLTGNTAANYGGGGVSNSGTLTMTGCTLTGNTAPNGGGVFNNNMLMLTDDILYGDTGGEIYNVRPSPTATYCDIQGNAGTPASPDANHNFGADPMFVNGAAPYDLHLKAGSPCIGKGTGAAPAFRATDNDGFPYAMPDPSIGAFEYHPPDYVVTTLAGDVSSAGTLRATIISANSNGSTAAGATTTITFQSGLHGVIALTGPPSPLVANVSIQNPAGSFIAVDGGHTNTIAGFQPFSISAGVTAAISGLTIQNGNDSNGSQVGLFGGGVHNDGTLTLTDCTLIDDHAFNYGGGVYNNGTMTMIGCVLAGNTTFIGGAGGGVFNNSSGTLTLTGCTLTGNETGSFYPGTGSFANGTGGGIFNDGGPVTLTNDILYGDTDSTPHGEIYNVAALTATDCDINQAPNGGSVTTSYTGDSTDLPSGTDPLFVNGAAPYDLHLKAGSPCIGKGTRAAPAFRATDNDGFPYAASPSNPSIGAFEYHAPNYVVTNLLGDVSSSGTLRAVIISANGNGSTVANTTTTITFQSGLTGIITLTGAPSPLVVNVTVQGPGAATIAVDGNGAVRPFLIMGGVTAAISGITLQNGFSSGNGGGVNNAGTLTLTGCTLTGNNTSAFGSGVSSNGALTMTNCAISNNGGPSAGQGVGVFNGGTLTMTGCLVNGNVSGTTTANYGGGVYNNGTATLTSCTLSGNKISGGGGGVLNNNAGILTMTGCTLTGNSAVSGTYGSGGGLDSNSNAAAVLTDDIFSGDTSTDASTEISGNVTAAHCDIAQAGYTGNGNVNADPLLSALGNYGGLTQTFALLPGSPCLGAGVAVTGVTTDQRGVAVPQGTRYDIGAFESQGFTVTLTGGSPQSTPITTAFRSSLTATVAAKDPARLEPVAGGLILFAAPASGASATLSAASATLGSTGAMVTPASISATANATAGSYGVTASTNAGSAAFSLTNLRAATAVAVTSSLNPSNFGQSVTFTATLTGAVNPTGSVTFSLDGGTPVAASSTAFTASGGTATLTTSALAAGSHVVTAHYSGDGNNAPSTSAPLTQTVTNTTVTVTAASGVYGQSATLTASLHGVGAIALPGRTLTFLVDGAVVGTAVTDGTSVATLHVTLGTIYAPGPHAVTVSFGGDAAGAMPFHAASTGTGTLTVTPAGSFLTVPGVPVTQGATATLRARLVRTPDHAALVGQTLTFTVDGVSVGTAMTDGTGQATLPYAVPGNMASGGHRITVTYGGTADYVGGSGTGTLSVFKAAP